MDEQQDRKAQQTPRKLGPRGKGGGMIPKENKKGVDTFIIIGDQKYKVENMAKGGRVGLKSGSKGCKLAMKGKGRAYGKNS
jgi:hypothetical protein